VKPCHFCGSAGTRLTKEHLWPLWLSRYFNSLGIGDFHAQQRVLVNKTVVPDSERRFRSRQLDMVASGVCEACNGNVLSELEDKCVKPILTKLCIGTRSLLTLDDQVTMNAWITRFAMVAELTRRGALFFTAQERRDFIESLEPPADSWIWLSVADSTPTAGVSRSLLTSPNGARIHVVTGVAGRFAFQALNVRWPNARPSPDVIARQMEPIQAVWGNALVQTCPNVAERVAWPPKKYLDSQTITLFCNRWGGDALGPGTAERS
jgi:hypothetical protein